MDKEEYNEIIEALTDHRKGVSDSKREDYTKGSEDVLANFKNVAESTGVSPLKVWFVYANKHWDAICNYIKSEGQSESEPIKERFGDLLNYLELGWGLISEENNFFDKDRLEQEKENIKHITHTIPCKNCGKNVTIESFEKEYIQGGCRFPKICTSPDCCCSTGRSTGI